MHTNTRKILVKIHVDTCRWEVEEVDRMDKIYRKQRCSSYVVIATATMVDLPFNDGGSGPQSGQRIHMKHLLL